MNSLPKDLHFVFWNFSLRNILLMNILHFWDSANSVANSLPEDLHFLLQNFCGGTFCTSGKVCWGILCGGNGDSQQYSNDKSFPLVAMASFFVSLRGSRARITSMEEKWLKPCEGMKGSFSSKCWTKKWRWREFRKLLVFPLKKWEQKCDKWLRKLLGELHV